MKITVTSIIDCFENVVRSTPDKTALTYMKKDISFNQMSMKVNVVAKILRERFGETSPILGVYMDRSDLLLVTLLGIIKAGYTYVPMDPDYPLETITYIVKDANIKLLLLGSEQDNKEFKTDRLVITPELLDKIGEVSEIKEHYNENPFLIYTSGSTGKPKGTWISQVSFLTCMAGSQRKLHMTGDDTTLFKTTIAYIAASYEYYAPLLFGGRIVIAEPGMHNNADYILKTLVDEDITYLVAVPSLLKMLAIRCKAHGEKIRTNKIACSGDALYQQTVNDVMKVFDGKIYNVMGITEASGAFLIHECSKDDTNPLVALGSNATEANVYILDEDMRENTEGLLYIGGNLCRSRYHNMDDLNKERYMAHPRTGERIFKTNDFVRITDGVINYIGRADNMFKIHGVRMEKEGIEALIIECEGIQDAMVDSEDNQLCAYLIFSASVKETDISPIINKIREHISKKLIRDMVPAVWYRTLELPKLQNGKNDRKNIKKINLEKLVLNVNAKKVSKEKELADLWSDILNLKEVPQDVSFFGLGGSSLQVIEMLTKVETLYKCKLSQTDFMENATLETLSRLLKDGEVEPVSVPVAAVEEKYEGFNLVEMQQAYLVGRDKGMYLSGLPTHAYAELFCEDYDYIKLLVAFNKLVKRHDMLRCAVTPEGTQYIVKELTVESIPVIDLSEEDEEYQKQIILQRRKEINRQILDLNDMPLTKIYVIQTGAQTALIQMYSDAIVTDGASGALLINELDKLYTAAKLYPAEFTYSFNDFVRYRQEIKQSKEFEESKAFWEERIKHFPDPIELPMKCNPEQIKNTISLSKGFALSDEVWEGIERCAHNNCITSFSITLTAFIKMLAQYSREQKFLVCVPEFTRPPYVEDFQYMVGEFSSFLILEADNRTGETFLEAAKRYQKQLWECKQHNVFNGMEVLRARYKDSGDIYAGIVPVVFTSVVDSQPAQSKTLKPQYMESHTTQICLDIIIQRMNDSIYFSWNTLEGLFADRVLNGMMNAMESSLIKISQNEAYIYTDFGGGLGADDIAYLEKFNDTHKVNQMTSFRSGIINNIYAYAEKLAVATLREEYTYSDLGRRASIVANYLLENHQESNHIVGIVIDKGVDQIAAILGCVLSGFTFMPLEYEAPKKKIDQCLKNAQACVVISDDRKLGDLQDLGANVIVVDDMPVNEEIPTDAQNSGIFAIIHTSGSTGRPKAVMLTESGLLNCIEFTLDKYDINKQDVTIALTDISHDMALFDIFGMLMSGGAMAIPEYEYKKDPEHWIKLLKKYKVSIWNSVPAMMEMLVEIMELIKEQWDNALRRVFLGGDYVECSLVKRVKKLFPSTEVISVGGPTETTLWNITHKVTQMDLDRNKIPYGRPINNTKYHILNTNLQPMPVGVNGMMYCEGDGVTRGYLGDDELTAQKFIVHPVTGERLYCTDDLGKYDEQGVIIFAGRIDNQVKILGKRIEIDEIQGVLSQYAGIYESVVCVNEESKKIIAFYKSELNYKRAELQEFMKEFLPAYMIPTAFYRTDTIFMTPNGKVDRKAMLNSLAPEENDVVGDTEVSEKEKEVLEIFCEVMGTSDIGVNDNFFRIGGDSIKSILIMNKIQSRYGIRFSISEFIKEPTVRNITERIFGANEAAIVSEGEEVDFVPQPEKKWNRFPLSDLQQSYLLGEDMASEYSNVSTNGYLELISESFDYSKFKRKIYYLVQRHDMFRVSISNDGTQQFFSNIKEEDFEIEDLSGANIDIIEQRLTEIREELLKTRMDISKPPLMKLRISLLGQDRAIIHMYANGMIMDGWSYAIFHNELEQLYADDSLELKPLNVTYKDYIEYKEAVKRTSFYQRDKEYWLKRVNNLPEAATLPLLKPFRELKKIRGNQKLCRVPIDQWYEIERKARDRGISPFMVLLTSFCEVILKWNKNQKVLINVPEFDRPEFDPDMNNIIGICSSFLLFTAEKRVDETFYDSLIRNQEQMAELKEHNSFSGMEILREVYRRNGGFVEALVPIVFGTMAELKQIEKKYFKLRYLENHTTQIWIDINTMMYEDAVEFNWNCIESFMDDTMLQQMVDIQMRILHGAAYSEDFWDKPVQIPLPARDLAVIDQVNAGEVESKVMNIFERLRSGSIGSTDHVAIQRTNEEVTFGEIEVMIIETAKLLIQKGVRKNKQVAIYLEDSLDQIVALLAVTIIGAVAVPFSKKANIEFIKNMLDTLGSKSILVSVESNILGLEEYDVIRFERNRHTERTETVEYVDNEVLAVLSNTAVECKDNLLTLHLENIGRCIDVLTDALEMNADDKVVIGNEFGSPLWMCEVLITLSAGATIVISDDDSRVHENTTICFANNSVLRRLVNDMPVRMRAVVLRRDHLDVALAAMVSKLRPELRCIGISSGSENSLFDLYHDIKPAEFANRDIPFGKAIQGTDFFVVNTNCQQVPLNVIGDIRVYRTADGLNGISEDRKIKNSVATSYTGKVDDGGNLHLLADEAALTNIDNGLASTLVLQAVMQKVDGVVTVVVKDSVVYFTAYKDVCEDVIRDKMKMFLTERLLPAQIIQVADIPELPNGRIDYNGLVSGCCAMVKSLEVSLDFPRDEIEENLVKAFTQLLDVDSVVAETDFFELGGNSLLAIKLLTLIRERYAVEIGLSDIFSNPTVSGIHNAIIRKVGVNA